MFKVFCCLGVAAAMVVGMYVGPGPATVGDLGRWGGLPKCNAKGTKTSTCKDCSTTYVDWDWGTSMLCISYQEPKQCNVTGCTQTVPAYNCNTDCEKQ